MRPFLARLIDLFRRPRLDEELVEEISAHLDFAVADNVSQGMTREDARRAAMRKFGGMAQTTETYRDRQGFPLLDSILQDLRYTVRSLRKAPGFTLVAIVVLALGIGANTAIFSLINALLLRPLSGVSRAGEIVSLYSRDRTRPDAYRGFSFPNYQDIRTRDAIFSSLMAQYMAPVGLTDGDITRRVMACLVSANYFATLGAPLAAGREFTTEEETPGNRIPVLVVSYAYWQKTGRDPSLVGSTLRVNGQRFNVVGVAPEGFTGTMALISPEIWLPTGMYDDVLHVLARDAQTRLSDRAHPALVVVGRLKPGLTLKTAGPLVQRLAEQMEAAYPVENKNQTLVLGPVSRLGIGTGGRPNEGDRQTAIIAVLLMCMAGLVLFVACLNLANMVLARGAARQKEIAIRMALGGGRMRIARQLLTEGLTLAIGGGAVGLLLAFWGTKMLLSSFTASLPMVIVFDARPDLRVLTATLGFCIAATMACSLGPALKLAKSDVTSGLKATGSESTSDTRQRWLALPTLLMVGQLALSLALLVAAGLFLTGALKASTSNPGFNPTQRVVANIDAGIAGYDEFRARAIFAALLERLRALRGVEAVSVASVLPFGAVNETSFVGTTGAMADSTTGTGDDGAVRANYTIVGADFFKSLGLPILGGREFTAVEEQTATGVRVAIIDQQLARQLFPRESPIGRRIQFSTPNPRRAPEALEIIGVVPGLRHQLNDRMFEPNVFVPFGQQYRGNMTVLVKMAASGPDAEVAMLGALPREIRAVDQKLPLLSIQTMRGYLDANPMLSLTRAAADVFSAFGSLAFFLATVGVYGVRAHLVSQRTREIGIRIALGATSGDVLGLILRETVLLTVAGLGVGLLLAAGVSRLLSSLLYGVSPFDPRIFSVAVLLLVVATLVASYMPMRRAMRVDPLIALRDE